MGARSARYPAAFPLVIAAVCIAYVYLWVVGETGIEFFDEALPALRWSLAAIAIPAGALAGLNSQHGLKTQLAFFISIALSVLLAELPLDSFYIFIRIVMAFALARACTLMTPLERMTLVMRILRFMALFVIASLLAWWLAFTPQPTVTSSSAAAVRVVGLASSPGLLGYAASIVLPCALYMALWGQRLVIYRLAWGAIATTSAAAIYLANSRSGMAAGSIGCLTILAMPIIRRRLTDRGGLRGGYALLCLAIVAAYTYPIAIGAGLIDTSGEGFSEDSTLVRLALWESGWHSFLEHPFTGIGLATPITAYANSRLIDYPNYFHTALLNYMAKTGLISAICFAAMVATALWTLLSQFAMISTVRGRVSAETYRRVSNLICINLAIAVATVVFSTSEGILQQMYPGFLLFFLTTASLPSRAEYAMLASVRQ